MPGWVKGALITTVVCVALIAANERGMLSAVGGKPAVA